MRIAHACSTLLLATLLSASLSADVLTVRADGSGDFSTVQTALAGSAPGDVVLLQDDFPDEVVVVNGHPDVVIVSDVGARHRVGKLRVLSVAAGTSLVLRGLEVGPGPDTDNSAGAVQVDGAEGAVLIEDCVLIGRDGLQSAFQVSGLPALRVASSAEVAVVRCTLTGGDGATLQTGSLPGVSPAGFGGNGVFVFASTLSMFDCDVTGGAGGDRVNSAPGAEGGSGVRGFACDVWLEGTLVQGGPGGDDCMEAGDGCQGGVGAYLIPSLPFGFEDGRLLRRDAQVLGGPGGTLAPPATGSGSDGPDMEGGSSVFFPGAPTLTVDAGPLRDGEAGSLSVFGPPGAQAAWMFSFGYGIQRLGGNKGVLALEFPLFGPYLMGAIPASGEAQFSYTTPSLAGTGLDNLLLAKQGLVLDADGLRFAGPSSFIHLGVTP